MKKTIRIGSRSSPLALRQSHEVMARITAQHPQLHDAFEIKTVTTSGDQLLEPGVMWQQQPGFFVREIETALLNGEIDIAVHSLKDLPTATPPGLTLAAYLPRQNPHDTLCATSADMATAILNDLKEPKAAGKYQLGTSSPRRAAYLRHYLPQVEISEIRGNVQTRLQKIADDQLDAIVLARAGLNRLDLNSNNYTDVPINFMLPAAAQGIIVVQCRSDATTPWLTSIDNSSSRTAAMAERSFLAALGAGCRSAVGVLAIPQEQKLHLRAAVLSLDGSQHLHVDLHGECQNAQQLGEKAAAQLLQQGAKALLVD